MRGPHFRFLVNTLRRGQAFFPHSLSLRTQKQSEIMRGDCYLILYTGKRRPQSEDLTEAGGWRNQQFGPRGPHSRCCVRPHGVLISVERQTWLPYSDLPKRNREGQRRDRRSTHANPHGTTLPLPEPFSGSPPRTARTLSRKTWRFKRLEPRLLQTQPTYPIIMKSPLLTVAGSMQMFIKSSVL